MTPFFPMFCLLMTGNPSPAVRQVADNLSKLVSKLPNGSIKDGLEVALTDKERRPVVKNLLKKKREMEERARLIFLEIDKMERRQKEMERNNPFRNIVDFAPKPKRRLEDLKIPPK
jgi:hypothetical protein